MCSCSVVIFVLVSLLFSLCFSDSFDSPCPTVFQYAVDNTNNVYGDIFVHTPDNNLIQLDVQMSFGNRLAQGDNGRLELAHSKEKIVNDILKGRPIHYHLYFPYWEQYPPKITKILLNDVAICTGSAYDVDSVPVVTTVTLQHVLTTNINQVIKNGRGVGGQFGRNSENKDLDVYVIDFKPQMPADPSKIYASNPFLANKYNRHNHVDGDNNPDYPKDYEQRLRLNPFINIPGPTNLDEAAKNYRTRKFNNRLTPPPFRGSDFQPSTTFSDNICGKSVTGNHLVANGSTAPRNNYPWLVAMYKILETSDNFTCGGTLISKRHVITAAHCLRPSDGGTVRPDEIIVALGRHNIFSRNEGITIEPEQFYIHEDYRSRGKDADIGIVLLKIDAPFSDLIRPICLWSEPDDLRYVLGQNGVVVGWGRDESGAYLTSEPKEVQMPIVSLEQCHNSNDFFKRVATHRTFCAGNRDGSGPCNGDSGSGFILLRNGRWTLRGVVSMSILNPISSTLKCDLSEYIVFTDISKFMNWINSIVFA